MIIKVNKLFLFFASNLNQPFRTNSGTSRSAGVSNLLRSLETCARLFYKFGSEKESVTQFVFTGEGLTLH